MSINDTCLYCNHPYTGRKWCKECDPEHLVMSWNIENESIRDCILNNLKKANNYDDPFLEYIPYDKLEIIETIGEGSYGVVYKAKWNNGLRYIEGNARSRYNETYVAIKEIKSGYDIPLDFLTKIEAHLECLYEDRKHVTEKLLRLYGITINPKTNNYIIVMDYKESSLRNYLDDEFQQSQWKSRIEILYKVSSGVKRIHDTGCIHGNLHCGNILVENKVDQINTFITGFECSSTSPNSNMNALERVLPYIAPEVLRGQSKSKESDVYSFGVIMSEMATGKPPLCDTPEINKSLTPPIYFILAKRCLDVDPTKRPTFIELEEKLGFWYDSLFDHNLFLDRKGEADIIRESFERVSLHPS